MAETQVARRQRPMRRNYSADQRASMLAALDANHGNLRATAQQFGVNESTLRYILLDAQRDTERAARVRALRAEKRDDLATSSVDAAWEALVKVKENIPDTDSARDAAVVFGIMVDKAQLLRGMPTQIVGHLDSRLAKLNDEQLDQIEKWLDEADQRQPCQIDAQPPVDMLACADVTDASGRQTVDADAERARDPRGGVERGGATPTEEPTDRPLGETGAPGQLGGPDSLVRQDGPQAGGEGVGG